MELINMMAAVTKTNLFFVRKYVTIQVVTSMAMKITPIMMQK